MMRAADPLALVFRQWLESPETYTFLVRFVEIKSRCDSRAGSVGVSESEDLCQEFVLFVLDSFLGPSMLSAELMFLIRSAQFRRILELAWGRFIWHRLERARSKAHNPRGYLYRRLREILRRNKQLFIVAQNRQGFLFYHPAAIEAESLEPFPPSEEGDATGYSHWLPPPAAPGQPPEKFLFSEQWLLIAADYFWQQAIQRETAPVAMPIRELCRFLADHHPWLNHPLRQGGMDSACTEQLADDRETPEEHLQRINSLQSVAPLAAQLASTWSAEQQQVFVLRLNDPPVKYEAIAARLGFADHNKAYALYQKALQSLQRCIRNWPGLPLSEMPEEVAQTFIEEMKRLCKNSLLCP